MTESSARGPAVASVATGWTASLGFAAGRAVIRLAFRGGGELLAESRGCGWAVVDGTPAGWRLVESLLGAGVLTARPGDQGERPEYRLAALAVASALDP